MPSDPRYAAINELWQTYSIAKNPQCWMNEVDLDDLQMQEAIESMEFFMGDAIRDIENDEEIVWLEYLQTRVLVDGKDGSNG